MDRFNVKDAAELFFREAEYEEINDCNYDEKFQYLKDQVAEMLYNASKVIGRQKC